MKLPGTTGSYGVRTTLRRPADRARRIYLIRVLNIRASRGEPRRVPFSRKARSSGGSRAARTPSSSSSSTSRSTRSPATSGRSGSRRGSRPRASSWSRRATRSPRSLSAARRRRRAPPAPTCPIELPARVDVDAVLKEHPAGGLDRAKRLVRKAKAAEAPPREDLEARLKTWKGEGLEVRDLEAALAGDLDTARAAFAAYEENVKKIGLLREILRGLDTKGFEAEGT